MAVSDSVVTVSMVAGTTFSSTCLYKAVFVDSSGHAISDPSSTGVTAAVGGAIGSLYGVTATTAGAGVEAVPVAIEGVMKAQMAASTIAAGQYVAASSGGLFTTPTTDYPAFGIVVRGSSGGAGRVVEIVKTGHGPTA
jgi:hypothetical protein